MTACVQGAQRAPGPRSCGRWMRGRGLVCPDGSSFSWAAPSAQATITNTPNLKSVTVTGSGIARDNLGGTHEVTFDVTWTGVGPVETTVNGPGSKRVQRAATATGTVTFDGEVLVDGPSNH